MTSSKFTKTGYTLTELIIGGKSIYLEENKFIGGKKNILINNNCNLSEEKMSLGATQTVPSRELK